MPDATSKIRIRMGQIEIEYEGAHAYLSADLPKLLETVVALRAKAGDDAEDNGNGNGNGNGEKDTKGKKKGALTGTVAAVAAKLVAKTGPDLAVAAAAQLTLVDGNETFKRDVLLKAMQSATSYYKQGYSGNLTKILKGLLDSGRFTESASGTYALTANERQQLEGKLSAG